MGGKAIFFVILGLSASLMYVNQNYGRLASLSQDNTVEYVERASIHNAAVSGANMACHEIYRNSAWVAGYSDMPFDGCNVNVVVGWVNQAQKIKSITSIATKTVNTAIGSQSVSDTVIITLQPGNFSRFAYYSVDEGGTIYWTTGDTVWGPFHTQDDLNVSGKPIFWGGVSIKGTLKKKNSSDNPQFMSSFTTGVDMPIEENAISDLSAEATAGGYTFPTTYTTTYKDSKGKTQNATVNVDTVYMEFAGDNILYKLAGSDGGGTYRPQSSFTSVSAATFSTNGVIFIPNAILRIKGTVKGQFTVACGGTGSNGDIFLDDNLVYNTDPANQSSTDILGLVAENDVIITNNKANTTDKDININASIYCENGGFGAEEYNTRAYSGNINLVGGIIQNTRAAVGIIGWGGGISNGFNKRYKYDTRFMFNAPPKYPNTGTYNIISWYE